MSFDWKQYLSLAETLAPIETLKLTNRTSLPTLNEEAKLRASISRAYYSAFCCARSYLESATPETYRESGSHTLVRNAYGRMKSKQARQIAADLLRLHEDRKRADYDDSVTGLASVAELALSTAHDIIKAVDMLT